MRVVQPVEEINLGEPLLAGVGGMWYPDPLLEKPGKVIEPFDGVDLSLSGRNRFDAHRLENVAARLRMVKTESARMELDAVELEITAEVGQEEVANEVARAKQSLTCSSIRIAWLAAISKGPRPPSSIGRW